MRNLVLTLALLAGTTPALASSIDFVTGTQAVTTSIVSLSCVDCPAPVEKAKSSYIVPSVPSGEQTAEIIDVDGTKTLKRVESWLGGSPVVVMTSAEGWAVDGSTILAEAPKVDPGVDTTTTTAAVGPTEGVQTVPAMAGFELRLK